MLIGFAVTAKLICIFVFAYADCQFSHDVAHFCFTGFSIKALMFRDCFVDVKELGGKNCTNVVILSYGVFY